MKWSALGLVCSAFVISSCARGNVVRVFDGQEVNGRRVSPEAYALFAEASLEEARGNRRAAAAAYERAVAEDPDNAAAWGRLGALRCTASRDAADRAFSRAEALEPDLESPWVARAECDLERRDPRGAAAHALRAVTLAPDDEEASRLVATALERSGDLVAARRWRRALSLAANAPEPERSIPAAPAADPLELALDHADATELERASVSARIGSAEVSLRAVKRGRADLANLFATRVLEADPRNSDARIAALSSADLVNDEESFTRWVRTVPRGPKPPSALGANLMEALISRRMGPEAARAWMSAYRGAAVP